MSRISFAACVVAGVMGTIWSSQASANCWVTNTFSNGTTADATQVNQNFSDLTSCAAPMANPQFSGLVGINMAPYNVLDVAQNINADSRVAISNNNGGSSAAAYFRASNGTNTFDAGMLGTGRGTFGVFQANTGYITSSSSAGLAIAATGGPIVFAANGAGEISRFATDGSFLVGTSANGGWPGNASAEFRSAVNGVSFYYSGSTTNAAIITRIDNTNATYQVFNYNGTGNVGEIKPIGTTGVDYLTLSDQRLKTISKIQKSYRQIIQKLWVGDFIWKSSGKGGFGILAQQAYPLFPAAIYKPSDKKKLWEADYGKFAPLALWGVKDLYENSRHLSQSVASVRSDIGSVRSDIGSLRAELVNLKAARISDRKEMVALKAMVEKLQRRIRVQTARN